jgi:lysophospholipase L1-like esterase
MHVAIIGDSIVHGYDDREMGGWVTRLKTLSIAKGESDLVYNLGVPGDSTREILKRADAEIKVRQPFLNKVVYSTGTNDMGKGVPLSEYQANLIELGRIARAHGNRVFFMGLFLHTKDGNKVDNTAYDSIIRDVCEKEAHTYIPTVDVIEGKDLSDGCHPNESGHAKLCMRVAEYLVGKQA